MTLYTFWTWIKDPENTILKSTTPVFEGIFSPESGLVRCRLHYEDVTIGLVAVTDKKLRAVYRLYTYSSSDKSKEITELMHETLQSAGVLPRED